MECLERYQTVCCKSKAVLKQSEVFFKHTSYIFFRNCAISRHSKVHHKKNMMCAWESYSMLLMYSVTLYEIASLQQCFTDIIRLYYDIISDRDPAAILH